MPLKPEIILCLAAPFLFLSSQLTFDHFTKLKFEWLYASILVGIYYIFKLPISSTGKIVVAAMYIPIMGFLLYNFAFLFSGFILRKGL